MFFKGGGVSAAGGEQNDFISCPRPPQETMTATVVGNTSRIEGKESMDMQQNKAPRIKKPLFQGTHHGGGDSISSSVVVPSSTLHSHQKRWDYQSSLAGAHKQDPRLLGESSLFKKLLLHIHS